MLAASTFYPPIEQYTIAVMDLHSDAITPQVRSLLPSINELAALGDAIHAIQMLDGRFQNVQTATVLLQQSADLLLMIAGSLSGSVATVLRLRAASLLGEGHAEAAIAQVEAADDPLILLCGPLSTWNGKSKNYLHGVVASVPVKHLNTLITRADSFRASNLRYLQALLGLPTLELGYVPPFVVTDLIACGGEANTYPKQFAYFLPEDEGVKGAARMKSVVYANLYQTRFHRVSLPLAEETLVPFQLSGLTADRSTRDLLLWFRGHDIGHSFRLPETDYERLQLVGLENMWMLQEAIADVMGYLMVANGPWRHAFQLDRAECSAVFLAELLRYIRRGPTWFPDSGSGFMELSYLLSHGYVSLESDGEQLVWHPDRLYDGMVALAGELVNVVLGADVERATALLTEHSFHPGHVLSSILTKLTRDFHHLPTDFAFNTMNGSQE